jgi:hypothetical protein
MLILAGAAAIELAGAPLEALLVAARQGADQLPAARAADLARAGRAAAGGGARGANGGGRGRAVASSLSVAGLMLLNRER